MVKIRLMRMGSKKRAFYRVMAIDERAQRYDPRLDPPALNLDLDAIDGWLGKGAQLSDTAKSLVNLVRRTGNNAPVPAPYVPAPHAATPASETLTNG